MPRTTPKPSDALAELLSESNNTAREIIYWLADNLDEDQKQISVRTIIQNVPGCDDLRRRYVKKVFDAFSASHAVYRIVRRKGADSYIEFPKGAAPVIKSLNIAKRKAIKNMEDEYEVPVREEEIVRPSKALVIVRDDHDSEESFFRALRQAITTPGKTVTITIHS